MKIILLSIILALTFAGCQSNKKEEDKKGSQKIICDEETKICPDGRVLSKTPPDCKFSECPLVAEEIQKIIYKNVETKSIESVNSVFDFNVSIPSTWEVEAVPEIDSLNFYDPEAEGETNLEKSQVFVRYFKANDFQTLKTIEIHERMEAEINNRAAIIYDIEKKSEVSDFKSQPKWRNERHEVTDIRMNEDSPSIFYIIGKRPELEQAAYDHFVNSIQVPLKEMTLEKPVKEFESKITKKPFGIYVTPKDSPIQPERFQGYHTGADVEYTDTDQEVPVFAIADGSIELSGFVNGYGGVVAIRHMINDESRLVIYGHLDPNSLPAVSTSVDAGQQIGFLGKGYSNETDGERKHLHLAIYKGDRLDLRGYVQNEEELENWIDPVTLY